MMHDECTMHNHVNVEENNKHDPSPVLETVKNCYLVSSQSQTHLSSQVMILHIKVGSSWQLTDTECDVCSLLQRSMKNLQIYQWLQKRKDHRPGYSMVMRLYSYYSHRLYLYDGDLLHVQCDNFSFNPCISTVWLGFP